MCVWSEEYQFEQRFSEACCYLFAAVLLHAKMQRAKEEPTRQAEV